MKAGIKLPLYTTFNAKYSLKTQHIMLNTFQSHRLIKRKAGKSANSTCKEFSSNALAQQVISPEVWWHEDTGLHFLSHEMHCSISPHT